MKTSLLRTTCRAIAVALLTLASANITHATPYATSLTNNAGTVSFRLNQTTDTNDLVEVISSGGSATNTLQLPGSTPISRGLIVTNLGIAAGTFKVHIKHVGSGVISTNSPTVAMGAVRGITCNTRTNSPYFGWVYISDSATNSASRGDGIFAFSSDLTDILGQGNVPRNGGYTGFGSSTTFSPYKLYMSPDDRVLVCDDSDATANLISMDPILTNFSYVLKPIETNPTTGGKGATPVGTNNNHGSIAGAWMVGSTNTGDLVLYTMDEDYQQDPTSSSAYEYNSVWKYTIGSGPLPWTNVPTRIIAQPYLSGFAGQNQGIQYHEFPGGKHYMYYSQRRSNPPQHTAYIANLDSLPDPSTYGNTGGTQPYGNFWASQDESTAEGYSDDILRDMIQMTVSPDGRWFAGIIAAGTGTPITAPDGSIFNNLANDIYVIPITNGVPNLPARQIFHPGGLANGRDIAFDAANNLYFGSSGLAYVQGLDIGESTDITTGSDGQFIFNVPATQVSVNATTPVASEAGPAAGIFTITRTPEDTSNPLTVFYTLTGTASNGVDYVQTTNRVTIGANQTSTNISITPIDDAIVEPVEAVILTVLGSGGYSIGFPQSATVVIADNETPQLQILSLSTNIYQGTTNDYGLLRIRRLGNTNVAVTLDANSFGFGGTAVSNVDYYLPNLPFTIAAGVVDVTNFFIYPTATGGSSGIGSRTILVTNLAGGGYSVTNNTATSTLLLKSVPAGTSLFSDNFENDPTGSNWNVFFAVYTNASTDYMVQFGYDYAVGDPGKLLPPIPAAPHSTSGDTRGLYMTVNKNSGVSAALNLYLKNHTFSGNYAVRFDMFLVRNTSSTPQSKVENALFGINHDGTHTNWFRNQQTGTSLLGSATASDGLMFDIGADGSGGAGANYDFAAWSGPTWTNNVNVVGPTNFAARAATTTRDIFKLPPYDAGLTASGVPAGGSPANTVLSATPTWAEVELSQIQTPLGNLVTYKVNNTVILSFYNTNSAAGPGSAYTFNSGTVMLGYDDPWDDIGGGGAGAGEGGVIFDNVRVVSLTAPAITTQPSSIVACAGTSTNLSVVVTTATGVTDYQWQHSGTNLPGATTSTLALPSLGPDTYGTYAVLVDDGAYQTISSNATVLPSLPSILSQPVSRTALQGSTLSPAFSVIASTCSQVTNYQWYSNNVVIAGRTNTTLSITNAQAGSFTSYKVTVSDGFNPVLTSSVVQLTHPVAPAVANAIIGGSLSMTFASEFGLSYVTEFKTNLADAVWIPLVTNAGNGNPITVSDSVSSAPTRFYRVRLQ
jgi:hypothetical protein